MRLVYADSCDCAEFDDYPRFRVASFTDIDEAASRWLMLRSTMRYFAVHVKGKHLLYVWP